MENGARYHEIALEPDNYGTAGTYQLRFATMPGMGTVIGDLHEGDLEKLLSLLKIHAHDVMLKRRLASAGAGDCTEA